MIEDIGFEVVSLGSGEAALALLAAEPFDLLVTDVVMPGMNGVELARRSRRVAPKMPILFASGYADVQTFGEDLPEGAVLKKPFRTAELAARLRVILEAPAAGADNVVEFRR
jgi:DNA-binding response OmpR family regulator